MIRRPGAQTLHIIDSPRDTMIQAACHQVGCINYHRGWDMQPDERTELGALQAAAIRSGKHGRTFREVGVNAEGLTVFRFDPYQRCFANHETRPELFVVRAADLAGGDMGVIRRHVRAADWTEDYQETLDRRLTSTQRG